MGKTLRVETNPLVQTAETPKLSTRLSAEEERLQTKSRLFLCPFEDMLQEFVSL